MRRKLVPPSVEGAKFIKSFNKDIETAQGNLNSLIPFIPVDEAKRKTINPNDFAIYPYSFPNNQMENAVMRRKPIPSCTSDVQGPKLIKSISKEIGTTAERNWNSPNKNKPDQEAKRKKKIPVNKDFAIYPSYLPSNQMEVKREPKDSLKAQNKDLEGLEMVTTPSTVPQSLLKLTIPKPGVYPCTSSFKPQNKLKLNSDNDTSWLKSILNTPNVVIDPEEKVLKVKINNFPGNEESPKKGVIPNPYLGQRPSTLDGNLQNNLKSVESDYDSDENRLVIDESLYDRDDSDENHTEITNSRSPKTQSAKCNMIKTPGVPDLNVKEEPTSNAIKKIIKTANYNEECSPKVKCKRASPSAKEANAGVLSITQKIFANKDNSSVESDNDDGSPRRKKRQSSQLEDVLENMDEINQDKDNKREKPGVPVLNVKEETTSNGIEKLIKAFYYIENCSSKFKSGRALPSTKESNEGILSIRQKVLVNNDNSSVELENEGGTLRRRKRQSSQLIDLFENMDEIHQDEDYKREKPGVPVLNVKEETTSNGIEKLIKAFYYIENCSSKFKSGRALPSTKESNEGILSIRQKVLVNNDNSSVELENEGGTLRRRKRQSSQLIDLFENMDEIHQDEDYIYPSLDSSEEEKPKKLGKPTKRKVDKAWNPQRRIGHVAPKTDRPCRVGTKNKAVEKALQAAAAKPASLPPPKRSYIRKKPKLLEPQPSSSGSSPYL